MASCDLTQTGHTGVIKAKAYVTELSTSGSSRYINLRVTLRSNDGYTTRRDASYEVNCGTTGSYVTQPMYDGFYISGTEAEIFNESFYVSVADGSASASISFSYSASLYTYASTTGTIRTISGAITTLYLTPEEAETGTPSLVTLSASEVPMGGTLIITMHAADPTYRHQLVIQVYNGSQYDYYSINPESTEYSWTVPDLMEFCGSAMGCTGQVRCYTYTASGTNIGSSYADFEITHYPATEIHCPQQCAMGSILAITLPRGHADYVHDLTYSIAGNEGSIAASAGAAQEWAIPMDLACLIPSKTSVTCLITCVTRWNAVTIGTEQAQVVLTVPDNDTTKPRLTMDLSPSSVPAEGFEGLYIRYMNGVRAAFTAESAYSSVASTQLTVGGITVTGNPAVSANLISSGKVTVTGRATDARGYSRTVTEEISVVAYDKPRVVPCTGSSKVVANRCDADGVITSSGVNLLIEAGRAYATVQKGETQLNFCSLQYRYKLSSASDYSEWFDLLTESDTDNELKLKVTGVLPDTTAAYTVQLRAQDTLGSFSTIAIPIGSLAVPFHIGKGNDNVAVGKFCDYSRKGAFEVGFTTYFDTGIALHRIFSGGTWTVGTALGNAVADANGALAYSHTVFLAVCEGKPVLLAKSGSYICGGDVEILYENETLTLSAAPGSVTAMYALL